jgi:hypothetical protein
VNEDTKALRAAYERAKKLVETIERQRREVRDVLLAKRVKPLQDAVTREEQAVFKDLGEQFNARQDEAITARQNALIAYENALVAERSANTGWLPVGTKVIEWERCRGWGYRDNPFRRTGRTGIVEVYARGAPRHEKLRDQASVGDVAVRPLKKDGTPGIAIETVMPRSYWRPELLDKVDPSKTRWWQVEGVQPPKEEE